MGRMSLKAGPLIRMNSCLKYEPEGTRRLLCRSATFSLAGPVTGHVLGRAMMIQLEETILMTSGDGEGCCSSQFKLYQSCQSVETAVGNN
jgi:hypothetical protein